MVKRSAKLLLVNFNSKRYAQKIGEMIFNEQQFRNKLSFRLSKMVSGMS